MRPPRTVLSLALLALLATGGCGDLGTTLEDTASCPGAECTDDARERYDAIAAVDRVTDVVGVSRSYRFDRGSFAQAEVAARVRDVDGARVVGEEVLGVLDAWPERTFDLVEATVVADPPVETRYLARDSADLTNPYFQPCSPVGCARGLAALRRRLHAEIDGLRDVTVEARGRTLRISGSTDPAQYALAAAGARRLVVDAALRLADRLEVEMTARGPLVVIWRLQDGLVCEQPPGTVSGCEPDNSEPFGNS